MRLENVSCSSALTMVESTRLMHSLNTCAMKASITRWPHHTHLQRMENPNIYTGLSWTMHVPFNVTQTYPQIYEGKLWRLWVTYRSIPPTRTLDNKTPFEMWYGECPDISHLRKLGYKVWVHIAGDNLKIYNRSVECILLRYSDSSKAYWCLHRPSGHIYVTWNIVFTEP